MKKYLWIIIALSLLVAGIAYRFKTKAATTQQAGMASAAMRAPVVQTDVAKPGQIRSTIDTVGSVEAANEAQISPRYTGRIEQILVREGDSVRAGQILVRIDPTDIEQEIAQRRSELAEARYRLAQAVSGLGANSIGVKGQITSQGAAYEAAKADLNHVVQASNALVVTAQANVTQAQADLSNAQETVQGNQSKVDRDATGLTNAHSRLERQEALLKDGYVSVQSVEDAKTALAMAESSLKVSQTDLKGSIEDVKSAAQKVTAANAQLAAARKQATADVAAARTKVTQAQADLDVAKANGFQTKAYAENISALKASVAAAQAQLQVSQNKLQDVRLVAPFDGTVTDRMGNVGSLASPGSAILTVHSSGQMFVRCSVPIETAQGIRPGMTATFHVDELSGEEFQGIVAHVNAAADTQSRQIVILIRMTRTAGLQTGMFGNVSFLVSSVSAAVSVPREAIKTKDGVSTIAVVGDDLKVSLRTVKLGAQNDKVAEVLEGVRAGEKIVTLSYDNLRDGQPVKEPGQPGGPGGGQGQGKKEAGSEGRQPRQ